MQGTFLYAAVAGVLLGVAAALLFHMGVVGAAVLIGVSLGVLLFALWRKMPSLYLVAAVLAAASLGMLRADFVLRQEATETVPLYVGQEVTLTGKVSGDPDRRETSLHVTVDVQKVDNQKASGKVLALLQRDEKVSYGDMVEVRGVLALPQPFETDTGHTFDYPGYLRAQGISTELPKAVLVGDVPAGTSPMGILFTLKHSFEYSLEKLFVEPDASLLEGILLGEKSGIPKDLTQAFIASGLVHVVVLSGYNITIVSDGIFRALAFLPRTMSLGVGGFVMTLFALTTGAGATTIRALIMALVGLLGRYLRRPTEALRALALAGAGMVLWNPESMLHDTSFILSVLATFGLITLSPWVEGYLIRLKLFRGGRWSGVRETAASTIAVQIFTLPALLYFSGVLSFLSVPANILGLPFVPEAMFFGFVAGLLGFISPALGFVPALLCDLILKWMMLVANTAASIPFGTVVISEFSPWLLVAAYIPLTWFAIFKHRKVERAAEHQSSSRPAFTSYNP